MAMPTACYHAGQSPCDKCRYEINRANWVGQTDAVLLSVMASHAYNCDCAACKEYNAKQESQKSNTHEENVLIRFFEHTNVPSVAEQFPHVFLED